MLMVGVFVSKCPKSQLTDVRSEWANEYICLFHSGRTDVRGVRRTQIQIRQPYLCLSLFYIDVEIICY